MRGLTYQGPTTRAPVRAFNLGTRALGRFRTTDLELSARALIERARRRARLRDFGDDSFREPLEVLTRALEREAGLHPFGGLYARALVTDALVNRLRLTAAWAHRPEASREGIEEPLFVLGLPRTGTTLTHQLLALDPAHRWLPFYEAHEPVPPPARCGDPRPRRAARRLRLLDYLAPAVRGLHPMHARGPEECFPLLANSLAGVQFSWLFRIPSYDRWLADHDLTFAYRYYYRTLQLLQMSRRASRWVLKSPAHLFCLDILLRVFPDARIVQLHRDPLRAVPSVASLTASVRAVGTSHIDPHRLGEDLAQALATGLAACVRAREQSDPNRFHDVFYDAVLRDPVAAVQGIYDRFGWPFGRKVERHMREYLARHRNRSTRRHLYRLETFGLDPARERRRFAAYTAHFRVPAER